MSESTPAAVQASPATAEALIYGRRLTDKILIAFYHACDTGDILAAEDLLWTLDRLVARPLRNEKQDRRKIVETQVDANYRLWDIKRQASQVSAPAKGTDVVQVLPQSTAPPAGVVPGSLLIVH